MFDTPFIWTTDLDSTKIIAEVASMINKWHLDVDPDMLWCGSVEEMIEYYEDEENTRQEDIASAYLEYVHNEASKYTATERLHYLAGRFY